MFSENFTSLAVSLFGASCRGEIFSWHCVEKSKTKYSRRSLFRSHRLQFYGPSGWEDSKCNGPNTKGSIKFAMRCAITTFHYVVCVYGQFEGLWNYITNISCMAWYSGVMVKLVREEHIHASGTKASILSTFVLRVIFINYYILLKFL